jgi:diguanylate cyclase (GGDEF)-like protein
MAQTIVLLEGFGKNVEFLRDLIEKSDFATRTCGDAGEVEKAFKEGADLVLLDLTNPDLTRLDITSLGFTDPRVYLEATVKKVSSAAKRAGKALLAIFDKDETEARYAAAGATITDFVTQPYYPEELVRRIKKTLGMTAKKTLPEAVKMNSDHLKVQLLRNLLDDGVHTIAPIYDTESPFAYAYPSLAKYVELPPEKTVELLDDLAGRAIMDRKLHDKVHLCPTCMRYNINFREVCPSCGQTDVEVQEMIHHFACGHVSPISQFQHGLRLICPKCNAELRHIGLDYEKPTETFLCRQNGHVFTDPDVEAACVACGAKFKPKDLINRNVYAYELTGRAEDVVQLGQLEPTQIDPLLLDKQTGIYHHSYFERELATEIKRSERHKHPFGLIIIGIDFYEDLIKKFGRADALQYMGMVGRVIREMIRMSDIPARYKAENIIMLLSETPAKGCGSFMKRLRDRLASVKLARTDVQISISGGIGMFPENGETAEALLAGTEAAFERAKNTGRDLIAEKKK